MMRLQFLLAKHAHEELVSMARQFFPDFTTIIICVEPRSGEQENIFFSSPIWIASRFSYRSIDLSIVCFYTNSSNIHVRISRKRRSSYVAARRHSLNSEPRVFHLMSENRTTQKLYHLEKFSCYRAIALWAEAAIPYMESSSPPANLL